MPKFPRRGSLCASLLAGSFGLLSACGEGTSASGPPGPGDAGAAGEPSSNAGKSGASAGHAGNSSLGGTGASQGGTANQAGAPLGDAGNSEVPPLEGGNAGESGSSNVAGAGNETATGGGAGGEGPAPADCIDQDGDGYGTGVACLGLDCNDADPLVNPSMLELADDGQDNDCTGGDLKAAAGPGYYVNGSDPSCSDAQDATGSKAAPYCSIAVAMTRAYQATAAGDAVGRSLFVAQGTYPYTTGTPRSMRVYGGYDANDWSYDSAKNVTILGGDDVLQDPDGFKGNSSWLSVNVDANAVIQGFHIQGGKKPGAPIFAVQINSSGKVELYDNVIVAGEGIQTVAVSIVGETKADPTTSNCWLIKNRISAGKPSDSSNYGVNNLGTAVLWGNVIDMAQGSGAAQSFGAAAQNYGVMTLVNNVLNGGDYGGDVDSSYGFINGVSGALPNPGAAFASHNVIFGGRGKLFSVAVRNDADLTLVNDVLGDRTPGPLNFSDKPTNMAVPLTTGFASETTLQNCDLYQLIYTDELSPPNAAANRHLFQYSDQATHPVDDLATVNACAWTGCGFGVTGLNLAVDPGFVSSSDFHLASGSALISKGVDPGRTTARGLSNLDVDGQVRPASQWDVGIDER